MASSIFLVLIFVASSIKAFPTDSYTTKFDNIDFTQILTSDRLLSNYVNCLLDKGHCTADALELKRNLPDALQNGCSKCSEKQKDVGKKVIDFMMNNKPDLWKLLEDKYDPERNYEKKYTEMYNEQKSHDEKQS